MALAQLKVEHPPAFARAVAFLRANPAGSFVVTLTNPRQTVAFTAADLAGF